MTTKYLTLFPKIEPGDFKVDPPGPHAFSSHSSSTPLLTSLIGRLFALPKPGSETPPLFQLCPPPPGPQVTGEATPGYLYCSTCPTYILKYIPKVKFLFTLRSPLPRAYSEYLNKVVDKTVTRTPKRL